MSTYQIAILRHAYHPDLQGLETPRIYCDDHNDPIEYDTIADAKDVIREWDNEIYVTSNGESGCPTYFIVESVDGDYVHGGRNGDLSNYDWNDCADKNACGECRDCIETMIAQDRDYLRNNAIDDTRLGASMLGRIKSNRKAKSSAANGRNGGRPKKK